MEEMDIDILTELAEEALTSPDKAVRDRAAARLRFMSCFDHWEEVKSLLPLCQSNYLRFIVCKAMHFVVSNELGPKERKYIQLYVLDYLTMMRERGEELPLYVKNELYSIYACAIYVNWRLEILSMEQGSEPIGMSIVGELSSRFPVSDLLDCILEVLTYFAQKESIDGLQSLRSNFVEGFIPIVFSFIVTQFSSCLKGALEVCCTIMEIMSTRCPSALITVKNKTDESIFLEKGEGWFPALSLAVESCGHFLLENPTLDLSGQCARFLRMASSVICIDREWLRSKNNLTDSFLELSSRLLSLFKSSGLPQLLQLGCALLVNLSDRDESRVSNYLLNRPYLIEQWEEAVIAVLERWEDGEEELRQELMHLFFLLGDRVIPCLTGVEGEDTREMPIMRSIMQVSRCYFDNVVAKAHLAEDSYETRSDLGIMLHNEKTLLPIAEMLFCEKIDIYGIVAQRLRSTIEQYEMCMRIRETGDSDGMGDLLLSLAVDVQAVCPTLTALDAPLFLMHVCLSRLSVIISTVAIAVLNNTAHKSDELVGILARFARELLSVDGTLTSALLTSLSLVDVEGDDSQRSSMTGGGKVHLGVLRALFFFCVCLYESFSEPSSEFYEIMINLLCYVYLHHSEKACLTNDANLLLNRVLMQGVCGFFLSSEKMFSILMAMKEERIELLRITSDKLTDEGRKARSRMLSALTSFNECRHYAGYPTLDLISCIVTRSLDVDRLTADPHSVFYDLSAIADGINQVESLYCLLDALLKRSQELEDLLRALPANAPLLLRLCAKLCNLATRLFVEDNKCETRWGLVGFAFRAVHDVMLTLGSSSSNRKESIEEIPPGVVSEIYVYDVADIIYCMISGQWCNLGVALFYSKDFIFLYGSFLSLLFSVSAELVMARMNSRERVFNALMKTFLSTGNLGIEIKEFLDTHFVWKRLLKYFVNCLRYSFMPAIICAVDAFFTLLENTSAHGRSFVEDKTIGDLFEELAVHITVSPYMELREIGLCIKLLTKCIQFCGVVCTERMEKLLDFCSAYHRVRLRHLFTLIRSGKEDVPTSYIKVFGMVSRVQTLSAW
ncbi:hypothetical protein C3747_2g113 [Trypanosoma cruzi]|uniref:Uncharacterized protein n=1 Tax=Trypanosoma cruzi TaxID=5693 RepID=A0A2V2XLQ1_TRYCR|nr:hypothetical protein C3747_2g113 [Trypanosoma cruzi]